MARNGTATGLAPSRSVALRLRVVLIPLLAALVVACGGGRSVVAPSQAGPNTAAFVAPTPGKVAIISIDGLRADALVEAGAPNIQALAGRGAYTWRAQTILPSTTLPSHTSMLTGYRPDVHGIVWDDYLPERGALTVPSLFSVARSRGLRTAMVVGKNKFTTFRDTGGCDTFRLTTLGDDDIATQAIQVATSVRPDLLFVHLPDVDLTGHRTKWLSTEYLDAVRRADAAVGRVVSALPADTTVIVTADHGGHMSDHGTSDAADLTIPWVIAGPAISNGYALATAVSTVDTAATAALLLGVELPYDVSGRAIVEAFKRR